MSTTRFALPVVVILLVAACSASAAPPSGSPTGSRAPSPSPTIAGIQHATGPGDVVLRMEQGGGFVNPEFLLTNGPLFTLYGDGTIVFRDDRVAPPESTDGINRALPYKTARLSEQQIQALLESAITEGRLGVARALYDPGNIADAGSTTFTLDAGGVKKTVSVVALGMESWPGPDAPVVASMAKLADRLRAFDENGTFPTQTYAPAGYRALLWENAGGGAEPHAWPWPELKATDFVAPAGDGPSFPRRVMTPADAAKLGIKGIEGGVMAFPIKAPDGKIYNFALRPLLPDEAG
ncbi:MAG: hypothetical protein ACJ77B_08290 [Chloroflexota bacterium]